MTVNGGMLLNGMLAGAAAYGLSACPPQDKPYAFTAMAIALFHGLLGVVNAFKEDEKPCSKVHIISRAVMEIAPLPLFNIQLYSGSSLDAAAFVHFVFVIPLLFDMITKLYSEESTEGATDVLKDMTILGMCLSTIYLAVTEGNLLYHGMAISAFFARYVSIMIENLIPCSGEFVTLVFNTSLVIFAALCAAAGGS